MPVNYKARLVEVFKGKSAEDFQDGIFRRMSAEKKIKLASQLYDFASLLSKLGHGAGKTSSQG